MVPTVWDDMPETARPLTRLLLDPLRGMVEEILGVNRQGEALPSCYWRFEYTSDITGRATLLDAAGNEMRQMPGRPGAGRAPEAPRLLRTADFSIWTLLDPEGRALYRSRKAAVAGLQESLDTSFARSRPALGSGTETEAGPRQHVGQQPGERLEEQPTEQPGAEPVAGSDALVLPVRQVRLVADMPLPGRELAGLRPQPGAPVAWRIDGEGLLRVSEVQREASASVRLMRMEQPAPLAETRTMRPRQPEATGQVEVFEAGGQPARDQPVAALGADSEAGQMAGPTDPRRVLDLLRPVTTEQLGESGV